MEKGKIFSINYSKEKNAEKACLKETSLIKGFGLEPDARAGSGARQVMLLAIEGIKGVTACPKARRKDVVFNSGDFGENITTEGLDLKRLKTGERLKVGRDILLEISGAGKECYKYCAIYQDGRDCAIPREAIFAKVLKGGKIAVGDGIEAE